VKVNDFQFSDHQAGGGIRGEVFLANNISLEGQGVVYDVNHSIFDEVSLGFNGYLPVTKPFSLFGHIGTLKGFEVNENWNYKVGGGLALAITEKLSGRLGGFVVDDFQAKPELRFDASVGFSF